MTSINSLNTELELSIVVPVHNEKEILESTVRGIVRELEFRSSDFELILVENGSTDNSGSIIEALSADDSRIVGLHLDKPSYGYALLTGLRSATGKIVGHFSVDIVDFEFFEDVTKRTTVARRLNIFLPRTGGGRKELERSLPCSSPRCEKGSERNKTGGK